MALAVVLLAPAAAPAASIRVKLHRPHRGIQVRLAPVVVPAAQEREVCQAIELPNREPMDVAVLQFATPGGCAFYLNDDTAPMLPVPDCYGGTSRSPVPGPEPRSRGADVRTERACAVRCGTIAVRSCRAVSPSSWPRSPSLLPPVATC